MVSVQRVVRLILWWMTIGFLTTSLFLNPAGAIEPERVSIQTLFSLQATSYQQRLVTLEGVTSTLQIVPPFYFSSHRTRCLLYGRASFVLEDETGSLPVVVLGSCNPGVADALPKDGDRVRVTGIVQVLKSDLPRDVRVQATRIEILE